MATLRRKFKPDSLRRLEATRTAVANQYGFLYGAKLRRWFYFNGQQALIKSADFVRFEERLKELRNAKGTSAVHRARREAEKAARA